MFEEFLKNIDNFNRDYMEENEKGGRPATVCQVATVA
jgi:hypothetical protein